MGAVFLDTGILLRLLVVDDPLHAIVRNTAVTLRRRRVSFCTSFQNISEFWNVSTRPTTARSGLGLDLNAVERRVRAINRWCEVLIDTPASYTTWMRLVAEHSVVGVAVHDARIAAIMLTYGVNQLVTLNERDFRRYESEGIQIVTPHAGFETS